MTNENENQLMFTLFESFKALDAIVRPLNPLKDNYLALSIAVSGWNKPGDNLKLHVFYGTDYSCDVTSLDELRAYLSKASPAEVRAKKIAELKAELAKLESEGEGKEGAC